LRSYLRYEKLAANNFSKEEIQTILEEHLGRTYVKLLIDALNRYQLTGKIEDPANEQRHDDAKLINRYQESGCPLSINIVKRVGTAM